MLKVLAIAAFSVIGSCIAMRNIPALSHNALSVSGGVSFTWGVVVFFGIAILTAVFLRKA